MINSKKSVLYLLIYLLLSMYLYSTYVKHYVYLSWYNVPLLVLSFGMHLGNQ